VVGGLVTGSAIQIVAPLLLGIESEGDSSFEIFWNTLQNTREAWLDAALGVSGLASLLYSGKEVRGVCPLPLSIPHSLTSLYSSPDILRHRRD